MRAPSSAQAPPKPRSPASKCAALRRGSGQLQRHCDCGGIIRFPDSPAPSACAFSSGNSITAGLQACQMRFCSPVLMHHDADGKELGEFSGFSNADFRGKMDDRGICDFSPEPLFAMRILACVFYLCDLIFHVAGVFAPAGATRGLCDRPLDPFAVHTPVTGLCRNLWIRGTVWVNCG